MALDYGEKVEVCISTSKRPYNREIHRRQNAAAARRRSVERRKSIERMKEVPCADCKGVFPYFVMDFDHRDPETKEFEINRQLVHFAWGRILAEIEKCDVVCACCHRLRSWKTPKVVRARQKLISDLKSAPCADCSGFFHYSQMDFDHVRGLKLTQVPKMTSLAGIRQEASKCDVVCANCHRVRTQSVGKGNPRLKAEDVDMVWRYKSSATPQSQIRNGGEPAPRAWHFLAGTLPDGEVAEKSGISRGAVRKYRMKMRIPAWRPACP